MRDETIPPLRITVTYKSPINSDFEDKLRVFMSDNEYEFYASGCTVGSNPEMRDISFDSAYAVPRPKVLQEVKRL